MIGLDWIGSIDAGWTDKRNGLNNADCASGGPRRLDLISGWL